MVEGKNRGNVIMNNPERDPNKERKQALHRWTGHMQEQTQTHHQREARNGGEMRSRDASRSGMQYTQRDSHAGDGSLKPQN